MRQRPSHTLAFSHPPGSFSRFLRLFCSHALYLLANDWIQSPASASGKSSVCLRKPQDSALFYCFRISLLSFSPLPLPNSTFFPLGVQASLSNLSTPPNQFLPRRVSLLARCCHHGVSSPAVSGDVPVPQAHVSHRSAYSRHGYPSQHESRRRYHVEPPGYRSSLPCDEQGPGCPECPHGRCQEVHLHCRWCAGNEQQAFPSRSDQKSAAQYWRQWRQSQP